MKVQEQRRIDLSVVVPMFNEEDCVQIFLSELRSVLKALEYESEIIIVDDASTDRRLHGNECGGSERMGKQQNLPSAGREGCEH